MDSWSWRLVRYLLVEYDINKLDFIGYRVLVDLRGDSGVNVNLAQDWGIVVSLLGCFSLLMGFCTVVAM